MAMDQEQDQTGKSRDQRENDRQFDATLHHDRRHLAQVVSGGALP